MLKSVLPQEAFFGRRRHVGPGNTLTDDSFAERFALQDARPEVACSTVRFIFLQRWWTWLYDDKNRIFKSDRLQLLLAVKSLLYETSEVEMELKQRNLLCSSLYSKYKNFQISCKSTCARRE